MSEYPYMQFYVSDWTSDPQLAACSLATRGAWMNALCAMHISGRAGELSGTTDQLARICRCLPAEMSAAIADLQATKAADVTFRNGVVTLVCRRMKRESDKRKSCLQRVKKHRNGGVTPESPPCNAAVTDTRASDSEVRGQKTEESINEQTRAKGSPTLAQAIEAGLRIGCPKEESERFWHHFEAVNWLTKNNQEIHNWQSKLASWWSDNDPRNRKGNTHGNHHQKPNADTHRTDKRRREYEEPVRPAPILADD